MSGKGQTSPFRSERGKVWNGASLPLDADATNDAPDPRPHTVRQTLEEHFSL
jgi:hypothetical protein